MKCKICNNEIRKNNLDKIEGTFIYRVVKNKKREYPICKDCQSEYENSKDLMLDVIDDK